MENMTLEKEDRFDRQSITNTTNNNFFVFILEGSKKTLSVE
jgi:hypothetical protein